MKATCSLTGTPFTISETEQEYCKRNDIPLPTICPRERLRHMMAFRNRSNLYNTTCDFSGKPILSAIPPESGLTVYDIDIWTSNEWDATEYGRPYDFNKPFFEQFAELFKSVPLPNLSVLRSTMENSDYTNGITIAKNCYLIFAACDNEDCLFGKSVWRCKNVVDCVSVFDSELCYDCSDIRNCYNVRFSEHCSQCSDSSFLSNCQSCKNCFGCVNLSNKEYHFYNEKLSEEEYNKRLDAINFGNAKSLEEQKERFEDFKKDFPIRYFFGKKNEGSTGNYINNTKNAKNCFFVSNAEDMEYCILVDTAKNCLFLTMFGNHAELVYNSQSCGDGVYNLKFCCECWPGSHDLEYCFFTVYNSNNCFGCVGVNKKSYCILNKQYTKEQYLELLPRVKEHMKQTGEYGTFFPNSLNPYYYNKSEAHELFPLDQDTALEKEFQWYDEEVEAFESSYTIPDNIEDVQDDILNAFLKCEKTGKKYKIIKQELDYYRANHLPIPRVAPMERIREKTGIFHINQLKQDSCSKCSTKIETMYDTSTRKVYCEKCFQEEMY